MNRTSEPVEPSNLALYNVLMPEAPICPYCRRRQAEPAWLPFCSERCKMADLGRWLSGDYRVAGPEVPDASDDEAHN